MATNDPLNLGELQKQEEELVKEIQRLGQLLYDPSKTDDEWNEQVSLLTRLQRYITDPAMQSTFNKLAKQAGFDPDSYARAALGASESIDPSQILSGALNTNTNRTSNRNTVTNQDTVTRTDRTTTTYVDVPTPEEFLDNFERSFSIHIEGLVQTGGLRPEVAAFAQQNKGLFYDQYLREQVAQLVQGKPLFRTVGLNADEKLVGSRTGEVTQDKGVSQQNSQQNSTQRSTENSSSVPSESPLGQALEQAGTDNSVENTTEKSTNTYDNLLNTTEAIVTRNGLAVVANLAPLDYLKDQTTVERLNLLFAGEKGSAQRRAATAAGQDFGGSARRVG